MASHSCDHLAPPLFPLWTSCATQKDEFLTSFHHHTFWSNFSASVEVFSKTDKKCQVDSLFDAHPSHQRKKKPKILNFIKFSQHGRKESALTEKRANKNAVVTECWNLVLETIRHSDIIESNALGHLKKQCFFLCNKSCSCSVHSPVTFRTHLVLPAVALQTKQSAVKKFNLLL